MNNRRVYFKTFGCRTNQFDTQIMISKLQNFKLSSEDKADTIVINSCTVTNGADSSVRGYINSIKKRRPNIKIILAGCGSYSKGESLLKDKKVFGVMGHSEKSNIDKLLAKKDSFYKIGDLDYIDNSIVEEFIGKSRAFIKIQEGCSFNCSYCIIPSVRGKARSLNEDIIISQIQKLAQNGFGEFILTGTNVGSYGKDTNTSLAKLLKRISQLRGVRRIRIGSLEPIQINDEFKEILNEAWMARHLHIALQHTSDKMLKVMNRRNNYRSDIKLLEEISLKGYAIGTDFIVGHPYEEEKEWSEAIKRVEELPLTHIHAFTYSKRDNTASAFMNNIIRGDIAKARHRELTTLIKNKNLEFRKSHNKNLEVLIENSKGEFYSGLDQYFNRVKITGDEDITSTWRLLDKVEVLKDINSYKI